MRTSAKQLSILAATIGLLLACACSHASSPSSGGAATSVSSAGASAAPTAMTLPSLASLVGDPPEGTFQGTYDPNTVVVDKDTVARILQNVSADGATYTFDSSSDQIKNLKVGNILLLYNRALRKVTSVNPQGSQIVIQTTDAAITDAVKDGTFNYDGRMNFAAARTSSLELRPDGLYAFLAQPALADGAQSFSGKVGDVDYTVTFTPNGERLDIDLEATWDKPYGTLKIKGQGWLDGFRALTQVVVKDHSLDDFHYQIKDMNGQLNLHYVATSKMAGNMIHILDQEHLLKIPAGFKMVFFAGGIPFYLEVSSSALFHPAFTSKEAVVEGDFSVDYNSVEGVSFHKGALTSEGHTDESSKIVGDTRAISVGPMGFIVAVEFPRIDVGLGAFGTGVGPYVDLVASTSVFTSGAVAMIDCTKGTIKVTGTVGVRANAFGFTIKTQKLSERSTEFNAYKGGVKCPGGV